ncbi:MAG: ribosome assembly cofactor RimP [Bacteroidales bacterium]|nr:ribosome assembly cofactor RimP [Bacteroidales bacterium]MCF8455356.1 ribosome assembly cofactor RimP [Bacteroidales bacterium]
MIKIDEIKGIVADQMEGTDLFLVDLQISTSNKISVVIDSWGSVSIDDCVSISRKIEGSLDRDKEDFALEVSSAGLDHPFMVFDQYKKNIDRNVQVITLDGVKTTGKLLTVTNEGIELEYEKKVKVEGKKKKEIRVEKSPFLFSNIKATKVEISFK